MRLLADYIETTLKELRRYQGRLPTTHCLLPTTYYLLPTTYYLLPTTTYQPPPTNYQLQRTTTRYSLLTYGLAPNDYYSLLTAHLQVSCRRPRRLTCPPSRSQTTRRTPRTTGDHAPRPPRPPCGARHITVRFTAFNYGPRCDRCEFVQGRALQVHSETA
jgi:hypothetical protein